MAYKVVWSDKAKIQLNKLGTNAKAQILKWISKNLINSTDPTAVGGYKRLQGEWSKYGRYRVGDYRLIVDIKQPEVIIEVVKVGNRKNIYGSCKMKEHEILQSDTKIGEADQLPITADQEQETDKYTDLEAYKATLFRYDGPLLHSVEELKEQARLRGIKVDG